MAPKFVHDKANFSRKRIAHFSSLNDTIKNINNKLTMEQKIMFEQTCFGNFLSMGGNRLIFSAQMVHQLLLRQVENPNINEMWFSVGEKTIRFSLQEFCVVTGLDCSLYPSVDVLKKVEGVGLRDGVFFGNMDLNINDLEAAFVKASIDDNKTVVKLALLYFLEAVLLAKGKNSPLDSQHLLLVDDLEKFNKYPWGRVCFEKTMNSLKNALREKKPTIYNLVGFPYAFQVWAFEAMPSIGTLGPKFATKDGCALPRINSWWSTRAPDHKKLEGFFESKDLHVDTFLELTQEEKQQDYLRHFINPASCEVPQTNIQNNKPQVDRADTATATQSKRLITMSYHEVVTVANKGKSPVEAALVEEPRLLPKKCTMQHMAQRNMCQHREAPMSPSQDQGHSSNEHTPSSSLARDSNRSSPIATPTAKTCLHPSFSDPSEPSWPSSQFYGHNSSFHVDLKTEIPSPTLIDQHVSISFPHKGNDGSPFSSLDDGEAFFIELNSILDKSPNELLDSSSHIILGTSQDINQAKHFLRHCLSTDFDLLVDSSQRDKVNSSLELLMKVGNFPPSMLNMVRTFRMNFLGNTDVYSKCKEHVERADKNNKEVMVLREELANNRCQYFQIMGDIRLATNEMKELTNEMEELKKKMEELTKMFAEKEKYKMDLEVKAKDLVEFTKTSKNTFDQSLFKLKNWEMEKESAEEHMADIESQWDEFKRKLAEFL